MGFIADLNNLSPRIKNFVISIGCLMPFWYLCVFLFNPSLFLNSKLDLLIPLSFCFSVLWYLVSLALNGIVAILAKIILKIDIAQTEEELILIGGIDSIIYLSIAIFIGYWSKSTYASYGIHYSFIKFLQLSFWFSVIRAFIIGIGATLIHKSRKP
jgi:hypothetical protein